MKVEYKGFEIEVTKGKSLGGFECLYFYVLRLSDGWMFKDSFEESDDTINQKIKDLKSIIDDYLENPQDYEEEWI